MAPSRPKALQPKCGRPSPLTSISAFLSAVLVGPATAACTAHDIVTKLGLQALPPHLVAVTVADVTV
eukprot:6195992-Amphidinium_carterae.1